MKKVELNEIGPLIRNGQVLLLAASNGSALIADARNNEAVKELTDFCNSKDIMRVRVLLDSDARLNRHVKDVPAVAWDIIDTLESALAIILDGAQNLSNFVLNKDGTVAFQMALDSEEIGLVQSANCPLIITELDDDEFQQNFSSIDYMINLPALTLRNTTSKRIPAVYLGPDNEVRVVRE